MSLLRDVEDDPESAKQNETPTRLMNGWLLGQHPLLDMISMIHALSAGQYPLAQNQQQIAENQLRLARTIQRALFLLSCLAASVFLLTLRLFWVT